MTFSTDIAKLTKADEPNDATLKEQGFKLTAINAYDDNYTTNLEFNTVYYEMNNLQFKHDKDNGWKITNNQSYFWPGSRKDLVFLAISSSKADIKIPEIVEGGFGLTGNKVKERIAYENVKVNGFTIAYESESAKYEKAEGADTPTQTSPNDDLMISDVVIQNQDDAPDGGKKGQVNLDFKHVLSKVQFAFMTSSSTVGKYPVKVTSLKISNLVTEGTLEVAVDLSENRTAANVYDWSPENNDTQYAPAALEGEGEDFIVGYELTIDAFEKTNANQYAEWLVIPQDITGKMVTIEYEITDKESDPNNPKKFTSVWPLDTEKLNAWERNQFIRYTVTLSPNIIEFNPTVNEGWESPEKGDVDLDN